MCKKENVTIVKYERYDKLKTNFTQTSNNIFFVLNGQPHAFMLYNYLCYRYNTTYNYAFPSLTTIQKELGMSKMTVVKNIKILEEKNLIKIIRQSETSTKNLVNRYVPYYPVVLNALTKEEEQQIPETFYKEIINE